MSAADTVLVLTHSADHYVIERVVAALARRGARAVRFDTDLFPAEVRLSTRLGGTREVQRLRFGSEELEAERVRAVWARKFWSPKLPGELEPRVREGCVRESGAALRGWLSALSGVRWVNPLAAAAAAEDKLHQLRRAGALGLRVPRTLVTNDPEAVRAFRAEVGELVAKMLTPLTVSMEGDDFCVRTNAVRDEDLDDLEGLRLAPMVFQERLEKGHELRVACVGARCFAGAIDASRSAAGGVDWRGARPEEARWEPGALDAELAGRLARLAADLGLVYGAADLIVTPAGETFFLELNPGGEWGMLERDLGLPIADALAEELLSA